MSDAISVLKSYLRDPNDEVLRSLADAATGDIDALRQAAWASPGDPNAVAPLFCALIARGGLDQPDLSDTARALVPKVPKGPEGDDVRILLGQVLWRSCGDPSAAEPVFRRVRRSRPADPDVLDFYRALFRPDAHAAQLVQVLVQARRKCDDREKRIELAREIAALSEGPLASPDRAIEIWRAVMREDGAPAEAIDALERLYRATEKWSALVDLRKDRAGRTDDPEEKRRILLDVAAIYRDRLGMEAMALSTLQRILELTPHDEATLSALGDTYAKQGRWNDLLSIYDRRLEIARENADREREVQVLREITKVFTQQLRNPQRAIEPLQRILELAPDDEEARTELSKIYEARKDWRALLALLRENLDSASPEEAERRRIELARLAEARLGDRTEAIVAWNDVLAHHGDLPEAVSALARLYEREGRWVGVAEMLRRQVAAATAPAEAVALLERLGAVLHDRLRDKAAARTVYQEILRLRPGHDKAIRTLRDLFVEAQSWDELVDLYAAQGRLADVVEILHGAADRITDVGERVALYRRVADLCRTQLGQPERAQRALERILAIAPDDTAVAEDLLPIYEAQGNWARVLSIHERLLKAAATDDERLARYRTMQAVAADRIGSPGLTLNFAAAAYALRPEDPRLRADLEAAAEAADGWDELVRRFDERASCEDVAQEERVDLLRRLAEIALHRLFKPDDAQRYYRRILEIDPEDQQAMTALEAIYLETRRWDDLVEIQRMRLAVTRDPDARTGLLWEQARLLRDKIGDLEGAAEALAELRTLAPDDVTAARDLATLQEKLGRYEDLARTLSDLRDRVEDRRERVRIELQLGDLCAHRLDDADQALSAYLRVLELDPTSQEAILRLEALREARPDTALPVARGLLPVYRRIGAREKEAGALEVLAEAETDPDRRLDRYEELASAFEALPNRRPDALRLRLERLEARPEDWDNRRAALELSRSLGMTDRLADTYARVLDAMAGRAEGLERSGKPVPKEEQILHRDILLEYATVLRDDLARPQEAEAVYRKVLDREETHTGAYEALRHLYEARGAHAELFDLLRRRADVVFHPDEQRSLLWEMIELAHGKLQDLERAVATAQELLDVAPDDPRAIARLVGLLEEMGEGADPFELEELIGRWADVTNDPEERRRLQLRRAELRVRMLQDPVGAVEIAGRLLAEHPGDEKVRVLLEQLLDVPDVQMQAAALLEPLYERSQDAQGRIRLLRVKKAQAEARGDRNEAVDRLLEIAELEERALSNFEAALADVRAAYLLDPTREDALSALERMGFELGRVQDVVDAWREALAGSDLEDRALRIDRLMRLAQTLDMRLGDAEGARVAYSELLDLEPEDLRVARQAVEALCRLHLETGDMIAWVASKRAFLNFVEDPRQKVQELHEIAGVLRSALRDRVGAALAWAEILDIDPADAAALDALEALFEEEREWKRLDELLEHRIEVCGLPRTKAELWRRLGDLRLEKLGDRAGAADAYQSILDMRARREHTVYALEKLVDIYRHQQRWADVEDVLRRLINLAADDATRVEWMLAAADVLAKHLDRRDDALEMLKRVLDVAPRDARARAMVSSFLEADDLRERAIRILTPLYEAEQNWPALLAIEELQAKLQPSGRRRLAALRKVAKTHEERLKDPDRAFAVLCAAMREAADQPELGDVLADVQRLGASPDRAETLYGAYAETVDHILDADLQRRVLLAMGETALSRLGRLEDARAAYERVLEAHPGDTEAFAALESIYSRQDDAEALVRLLRERAAHVEDTEQRDALLLRAADLYRNRLHRPEDAIFLLEATDPATRARPEVEQALEALYEETGKYQALASHLAAKLGRVSGPEAVDVHVRLGRLHGEKLGDPEAGVRHLGEALRLDPERTIAADDLDRYLDDPNMRGMVAEMLDPIFASIQDWQRLIKVQEVRLAETQDPAARRALLLKIARMEEEQLEDLERAFESYLRLFREDPTDPAVRDHVRRLGGVLGETGRIAAVYTEVLEEAGDLALHPDLLPVAKEAAALYERSGADAARAVEIRRKIHEAQPESAEAFDDLVRVLSAAGRWRELYDLYRSAADQAVDPERIVARLAKAAQVALDALDDKEAAISAYRRILETDPGNDRARSQLDALYEQTGRHRERVELLQDALDRTEAPGRRGALYEAIVGILDGPLGDPEAAVDRAAAWLAEQPDADDAVRLLEELAKRRPQQRIRIADVLQPFYEARRDFDRLVELGEYRLAAATDPSMRHELIREMAALQMRASGGQDAAFRTLVRGLSEPGDEADYAALDAEVSRLAAELGRMEGLASAQVAAARSDALAGHVDRRRSLLVAAARTWLGEGGDPTRAVEALDEADGLAGDDEDVLALLDQALEKLGHHERLREVLARRVDATLDDLERIALLRRLGRLVEDVLVAPEDAEAIWRRLVDLDPSDEEALARLGRAYERSGSSQELAEVLRRRIEAATDPQARRELRWQLVSLLREAIKDRHGEIEVLQEMRIEAPDDVDVLESLARALIATEQFEEAVTAIVERAGLAESGERKAQILVEAARLQDAKLHDAYGALERLSQALAAEPDHGPTHDAFVEFARRHEDLVQECLDQISGPLERAGRWRDLADLWALRAQTAPSAPERAEAHRALAELRLDRLDDPKGAVDAYLAAFEGAEDDQRSAVLQAVAAAATRAGEVPYLLQKLADLAHHQGPGSDTGLLLAGFGARIAEEAGVGPERALAFLEPVVRDGSVPLDEAMWIEAERLARAAGRSDLLPVILRRLAEEGDTSRTRRGAYVRLGRVLAEAGKADEALDAYLEALGDEMEEPEPIAALEDLLPSFGERPPSRLLDVLEEVYEARNDLKGLARVLRFRVHAADEFEKPTYLRRLADVMDRGGEDAAEILEAWGALLARDPTEETAIARIEALASDAGLAARAAQILLYAVGVARKEGMTPVPAGAAAVRIIADRLGDLAGAREVLGALAAGTGPMDPVVLELRLEMARRADDAAELYDASMAAAEAASDPQERAAHIREAAAAAQGPLGDPGKAIEAWTRLVQDPELEDEDAWDALLALLSTHGPPERYAKALRERAEQVIDAGERTALRRKLAHLLVDKLGRPEDAAAVLREILADDPTDEEASRDLEVVLRQQERFEDVADLLEARVEVLEEPERRAETMRELVRICVGKLADPGRAIRWLTTLAGESPSDEDIAQLERLLRTEGRWDDLADLLERRIESARAAGDAATEAARTTELADILARHLDETDRAQALLQDLLDRDPNHVGAILALASVYEARGDEGAMRLTLQRAAALDPTGPEGARLHMRLAAVATSGEDRRTHLEKALELDPGNVEAATELLSLARNEEDWPKAAYLLETLSARTEDPVQRRAWILERVDLLIGPLENPVAALHVLAPEYEKVQDDAEINRRIADALFAAERYDDAKGMYEWLVAVGREQPRPQKVLAHDLCRLARIEMAAGQADTARTLLEEAYKIHPTHVETLVHLGRIAEESQDWQTSLRLHRTMLLQNADRSGLVERGDIYLHLARAHRALGETQKAVAMVRRGLHEHKEHAALAELGKELGL